MLLKKICALSTEDCLKNNFASSFISVAVSIPVFAAVKNMFWYDPGNFENDLDDFSATDDCSIVSAGFYS